MSEINPLTILVDLDDTMTDLLHPWTDELNRMYGTNVKVENITTWNMVNHFPLTGEQLYKPLKDPAFWDEVKPKEGAVEYIKLLIEDGHTVCVCTASDYRAIEAKAERCLFKHFDYLTWRDVIVTSRKNMITGDVFIDDGLQNFLGVRCKKLLMDAPHNRNAEVERRLNLTRIHNWKEAYDTITEYAKQQKGYIL